MDSTVRTGCKPTIKTGAVKPYRQVCRIETRRRGRKNQDLLDGKPGRASVSSDRGGRGAEKQKVRDSGPGE